MNCVHCEKLGIDHDTYVEECLSSPRIAGIRLAGFDWFNSELHSAIDKWYLRNISEGVRKMLVLLPRGHMKTYYLGLANMLWTIINNKESRILYTMASNTQAGNTLEALENIFINSETLKHFFPKHILDETDKSHIINQTKMRISRNGIYREGTVEARGRESRVTGGHFTKQIMDDLIDENMVDSDVLQEKALNFIKRADPLMVNPGEDERMIIGTFWPGVYYNTLTEPGGICEDYKTLILGCYVDERFHNFLRSLNLKTTLPDGAPIWQRFTRETLQQMERKNYFEFSHQYLNIPIADKDRRFRREDIMYYNIGYDHSREVAIAKVNGQTFHRPFDGMYTTMTIDPATGEGANTDESAITVCSHDKETGLVFVRYSWDEKVTVYDLIDKIMEVAQEFKPHAVSPEDVAFQKTLKHFIRQECIRRGIHFPIRPVKPGTKSKGARILDALQPFIQNQQVYFQRRDKRLIDELVNLQIVGGKVIGRSPNLADSLAYHAEFWRGGPSFQRDDEDDVSFKHPFLEPSAAYGLECVT